MLPGLLMLGLRQEVLEFNAKQYYEKLPIVHEAAEPTTRNHGTQRCAMLPDAPDATGALLMQHGAADATRPTTGNRGKHCW